MKTTSFMVADLLAYLGDKIVQTANVGDFVVSGLTSDSRQVAAGDIFVAVKGNSCDGNQFVADALERGCSVVLFSDSSILQNYSASYPEVCFIQFSSGQDYFVLAACAEFCWGFPADRLRLIGVTGTNGKTTTCYLVNHLLRFAGVKTALLGTVAYDIDGEVFNASHTTPDPIQLQKILRQAVAAGVEAVVMEVSSHAASQNRTGSALFDVLAFTNLSGDHLDYHQNMENYFAAKRSIFTGSLAEDGTAVINVDDEWGRRLAAEFAGSSYGFSHNISNYQMTEHGARFRLDDSYDVEAPLFGRFNACNAAASLKMAFAYGIDPTVALEGLKTFPGVPGRLQSIRLKNEALAFVDYAHTDDALVNVGRALAELPHNKIITVFGCGGDRDRSKRPRMAQAAESFSDVIIVTADNSRSEDPEQIFADIVKGFSSNCIFSVVSDRAGAIARAVELAQAGDLILVAGKGHEDYQIERGETRHFSDLEQLQLFATDKC